MRELGEGMRRIFELMKSSELAPPDINVDQNTFTLSLHHRPMYNKDEAIWLQQYDTFSLTREEKAIMLIGRRGDLIAPNDIIRRLGIVDIEHYRRIVHSLQTKGLLESAIDKNKATRDAKKKKLSIRDFPRFKIKQVKDALLAIRDHLPDRIARSSDNSDLDDAMSGEAYENDLKIYVGNIPPNTTRRDVLAAFVNFGAPVDIIIPMSGNTNKGYAFVEFGDPGTTRKVLGAQVSMGGRRLTIRRKSPRAPSA